MYLDYFGFKEFPFSIAPDPRFLFLSERHKEALAHLLYGVQGQGGFILLTGEVGTGKTTVCRSFLEQVPECTDVAYIVNPKLSARELLGAICDDLDITNNQKSRIYSIKHYTDAINHYLLNAHSQGRHTVLIIDEAQNLSVEVLEQIRLLTNLETSEKKLLQIILLGQPELKALVGKVELRQLAQRITARYHLDSLDKQELAAYIKFRLQVAGRSAPLFSPSALNTVYRLSRGVPRLINLICDRALLATYANEELNVTPKIVRSAAKEAMGAINTGHRNEVPGWLTKGLTVGIAAAFVALFLIVIIKSTTNNSELLSTSEPLLSSESQPSAERLSDTRLSKSEASSADLPVSLPILRDERPEAGSLAEPLEPDSIKTLEFSSQSTNNPALAMTLENTLSVADLTDSIPQTHRNLMQFWKVDSEGIDVENRTRFCQTIKVRGMSCSTLSGSWLQLLEVNHPSVLILRLPDQPSLQVLLVEVDSHFATIYHSGKRHQVALSELQKYWYGQFYFIWKTPSYRSSIVMPGAPDTKDEWVNSSLLQIRSRMSGVESTEAWPNAGKQTKREIKELVKYFQRMNGLDADGIVGEQTEIRMSTHLYDGYPKLRAN